MSNAVHDLSDPVARRARVYELCVTHDTITVSELINDLTTDVNVSEATAIETLDELERNGFIYLVGRDADRGDMEVRLP